MAPSDDTNQTGSIARAAPASLLAFPFSPPILSLFFGVPSRIFLGPAAAPELILFGFRWVIIYLHISILFVGSRAVALPTPGALCLVFFLAFVRWPYVDGFPGLLSS
jgi:hypothetical protein